MSSGNSPHARPSRRATSPRFGALLALAAAWCTAPAGLAQTDWKPRTVHLAGAGDAVYVVAVGAPQAEKPPELHMWHLGPKRAEEDAIPDTSRFLEWIVGRPLAVAADAESLKILYADLSVACYYADRPPNVATMWGRQSGEPPLAWGGDVTRPAMYALARAEALRAEPPPTSPVDDDEEETDAVTTAPASSAPAFAAGSLVLVRLEAGRWTREAGPAEAAAGVAFWLAARDGVVHLFWQAADGAVLHAARSAGAWEPPATVLREDDFLRGWAGIAGGEPAFVAGRGSVPSALALHVYTRAGATWADDGPAREGREIMRVDGAQCGVCLARGRLAVVRPTAAGGVEFGWGELIASPSVRFWALPDRRPTVQRREMNVWDSVLLGAALGIFTMALFVRREHVNQPAAVPQGFSLAAPWKRLAATAIDATPAVIIVTAWTLLRFGSGRWSDHLGAVLGDPEFATAVGVMNYSMVGLYALWCTAWELATRTTPGKRIVSCRILGTDGFAPGRRPLLIRNGVRLLTVLLGAPGLLASFLMLALLTRNRQSLHDVMAGTMVVSWDGIQEARRYDDEQT